MITKSILNGESNQVIFDSGIIESGHRVSQIVKRDEMVKGKKSWEIGKPITDSV
jgi:hypothetical protein